MKNYDKKTFLKAKNRLPMVKSREELGNLLKTIDDGWMCSCIYEGLFSGDLSDGSVAERLGWLCDLGFNPDSFDSVGNSPLHNAALSNFSQCARVLLARGANPLLMNDAEQLPSDCAYGSSIGDFLRAAEYEVADTFGSVNWTNGQIQDRC